MGKGKNKFAVIVQSNLAISVITKIALTNDMILQEINELSRGQFVEFYSAFLYQVEGIEKFCGEIFAFFKFNNFP